MAEYKIAFIYATLAISCIFIVDSNAKLVIKDLSYTYNNETLYWPSMRSERFRFVKEMGSVSPYYAAKTFYTAEHGGTHMDAPSHFVIGKNTADQVSLTRLIGKAVVINVIEKAMKNKDLLIGKTEFEEHEKKHGRIPDGSIILLLTGWGRYWPNNTAYFGTSGTNTSLLHFPGLHPNGATWLIQKRKIKSIGIDTASIDYGQSATFQAHRNLMQENVPVFENVANLDTLPATGAMVHALPMKIGQGTGGPLRIVATWDDKLKVDSSAGRFKQTFIAFIIIIASIVYNLF